VYETPQEFKFNKVKEINSMYIEESIWGYVIMIGIVLIGLIYQEIKGIS
jgi:hypothetical protein